MMGNDALNVISLQSSVGYTHALSVVVINYNTIEYIPISSHIIKRCILLVVPKYCYHSNLFTLEKILFSKSNILSGISIR